MRNKWLFIAFISLSNAGILSAAKRDKPESDTVAYTDSSGMTEDQVVQFLEPLKKGTPVELTLEKGKVVRGRFSHYDDYYESIWIIPQGPPGVFREKSYKVSGIRNITLWDKKDQAESKSEPPMMEDLNDDHYLLKKEGLER
jgi:hypothetical protein